MFPGKANTEKGVCERTVTHAISEGVLVEDFYDFLHHYDKVIAVRRPNVMTP